MTEQKTAYVTAQLRSEVGAIRKRDVDRAVSQRINRAEGDVTIEQVNAWEAEAYREWRRQWPVLNNVLIPHGGTDD